MTSKFLKAILFACFFLTFPAWAENVSVNVTGYGASHDTAVLDGLKQAVAQVSGITLDAESLHGIQEIIANVSQDGQQQDFSQLTQETQSAIASKINGFISGYQIGSLEKNEDGLYAAEMTVNIEKYSAPGAQNNRYGLAVVGIKSTGGKCFGSALSSKSIEAEATRALVSAFTATRKFSVLDRDEQEAYDLEKAFISDEDVSQQEKVKLGNVKGTDFVITGKLKDVNIWENVEHIALTGENISTKGAKATMEYKLMVFATRQVKVSTSVTVSLNATELSGKGCSDILALLMKKIADKISSDCIENIYPAMVLNVKGNNVYINMGGDAVKTGSYYGVYATGEELIDPYTGESLGAEETRIGQIKITTVKPKYSVGEVVEGNVSDVMANQICRKELTGPKQQTQAAQKSKAKAKSAPQPAQNLSLPLY